MTTVILILIILAILNLAMCLWGKKLSDDSYYARGEVRMWVGGIAAALYVVIAFFGTLSCFRWQIGEDIRTGYIYSVDEYFGKGNVHIRLGENAGEDTQQPFCVSGDNLRKVKELAGSSKKVKITIPISNFHFENDFFACTSEPIIETYEELNENGK